MVLAGRTALVTGAARGIGRATAARLAREGARVLVVDRDRRGAEEAAAEIRADGGEASPLVADLTRRADVRRAVQAGARGAGGLGVLVNNAGGYDEPRVNCLCPHTVATRAVRRTIAELRAAGEELPPTLEGQLLEPEEVAELITELVTDERLAGRVLVCRGGEPPRLLPVDVAW